MAEIDVCPPASDETLDAMVSEAIDFAQEAERSRTLPVALGVVRDFDEASRDQAGRVMQRLKSASVRYVDVPLALPTTLRNYESQTGPELVALIDATAIYPLLAAQFASLRRLPMFTVLLAPDQKQTGARSGPPAIALFAAGRPAVERDSAASARVVRLHNIATRSVVVAPALSAHSSIELASSNVFTGASARVPRRVFDDATFTFSINEDNLTVTHSSPGLGNRIWAVDEVTLAGIGRIHTIKLDSAVPVTGNGVVTLRKIGSVRSKNNNVQR